MLRLRLPYELKLSYLSCLMFTKPHKQRSKQVSALHAHDSWLLTDVQPLNPLHVCANLQVLMAPTNGKRTSQAKERSWATRINVPIFVFALLAPSAAVLWGNAGALAGFVATALMIIAVMKLCSFMHYHDSLRCGPAACPWFFPLCYKCLVLHCFLGSRAWQLSQHASEYYLALCSLLGS